MASGHICPVDGTPLAGALDGPGFAAPGEVVLIAGTDSGDDPGVFGRVRLWWRCCGTAVVEHMADPASEDNPATYSAQYALSELSPVPPGVGYSVPCRGAAWSPDLPCGHVAGEGCDWDAIAAEAAGQGG